VETVDQGHTVISLITAKEYLQLQRMMIAPFQVRKISRLAVRGIVEGVASLESHNAIFLIECT